MGNELNFLNDNKAGISVKGILAQDLGFVWGPFQRRRGNLGVEVKRGGFQRMGEASRAFLRLIPAHWFASDPYFPSSLTI
jgi:hypothetical protein